MKKTFLQFFAVVLLLITIIACNNDTPVTGITLEPATLTLEVDQTATLTVTVHPNNATNTAVRWASSNLDIATVANGTVRAIAVGTVTITVTTEDGNFAAECTIAIIPAGPSVVINGIRWATRNLAAHGVFVENPENHGALFQWGRKGDGHEQRTSPSYPNNTSGDGVVSGSENFDTNGQIVNTHTAYGKFIKQMHPPYDWRSPQDGTLWNSGSEDAPIKTINDPCPNGWRLPTRTELATLGSGRWTNTPVAGRCFGSGDSTLFLPAAGFRDSNYGGFFYEGRDGYYWSSNIYETGGYYLYFASFGLFSGSSSRASGFSVRCVAEQ